MLCHGNAGEVFEIKIFTFSDHTLLRKQRLISYCKIKKILINLKGTHQHYLVNYVYK